MTEGGSENTDAGGRSRADLVAAAAQAWGIQLFDGTGRNQLLFYRNLTRGTLDLAGADAVALTALLGGRPTTVSRLFPADARGEAAGKDAVRRASTIRAKAKEALEERGLLTCFLASSMATWQNDSGAATPNAPLVLTALSITPVGVTHQDFELSLIGEPEVNPSLLTQLRTLGIEIPDGLSDLVDPADLDVQGLSTKLAEIAGTVPGFAIAPGQVVGTFSYAKMPMVQDLETNLEALAAHDIVAALAGDRAARMALAAGTGNPVPLSAPDHTPPADEFLVLDADSSQSHVINSALAGHSLVVEGPPGTGKSQTIANLIATLVARGQSVLFVAEKRAAITAVLDRLERVGLGELCLDLHAGAGSKRKLAETLAAGLRSAAAVALPNQRDLHDRLVQRREKLIAHSTAMHAAREPWQVSQFELQSELLGLSQAHGPAAGTSVRIRGEQLTRLTRDAVAQAEDRLYEYMTLGGLTLDTGTSPWAGAPVATPEQAESAFSLAMRLGSTTSPAARAALDAVLAETRLRRPQSVAEWSAALALLARVETVQSRLQPAVFAGPLPEMVAATAPKAWRKANAAWPGAGAGWGARMALTKQAKQLWADGKPDKAALHGALMQAHTVAAAWSRTSLDGSPPRLPASMRQASGAFDQLTRELAALGAYLAGSDLTAMPSEQMDSTLHRLVADERTLRKLPRINELRAQLDRAGLAPLVEELRARGVDPDLARAILRHCWCSSVQERIGFDDPAIASFNAQLLDRYSVEFQEADSEHIARTADRIRRAAAENLVRARDHHPEESLLVADQSNRKRGHLPLRQLFGSAPHVLSALKPCWAMSPLMVSQLLPGDRPYFDVVVFDEASQIVPADAMPAILRAKRVIVAGDSKQLPPTSFFASATDDDEDEAVNEDGSINLSLTDGYEAILDVMRAALGEGRTRSLTWHYRSRDERLIGFSNAWIYDRSLRTFPGVAGADCLHHLHVEQPAGIAGQENSVTAEVAAVVDLMLEHARVRPEQTLGVIAMGIKHAQRIDEELRRRLVDNPDVLGFFDESAIEPVFVKNLERVQGDERDAIILSIGYGKDPNGNLPYRFGPLNQEGGHRRLNVAITRARARMTLVSSFTHLDMPPEKSNAEGVKMLRGYLQYAASGGQSLGDAAHERPRLNPFEISVRTRLQAVGIPITAQYGVSGYWIDFAAAHPTQPGRMVLAIEADGATYHSSATARDRDRLRQEQLERLGWTFHRIWSTDWWHDADACITKARAAYDRAVAAADAPPAAEPARDPSARTADSPHSVTPRAALSTPPRTPSNCPVAPGRPIIEYSRAQLQQVIAWIESDTLLRTEEQLYDEFRATLGFQRRGSRIKTAFENAQAAHRAYRRRD